MGFFFFWVSVDLLLHDITWWIPVWEVTIWRNWSKFIMNNSNKAYPNGSTAYAFKIYIRHYVKFNGHAILLYIRILSYHQYFTKVVKWCIAHLIHSFYPYFIIRLRWPHAGFFNSLVSRHIQGCLKFCLFIEDLSLQLRYNMYRRNGQLLNIEPGRKNMVIELVDNVYLSLDIFEINLVKISFFEKTLIDIALYTLFLGRA